MDNRAILTVPVRYVFDGSDSVRVFGVCELVVFAAVWLLWVDRVESVWYSILCKVVR